MSRPEARARHVGPVITIGLVTGRAEHARAAEHVGGPIGMRLAHPSGVIADGAGLHHTDGAGGFFGPAFTSRATSRGDSRRPIRSGGASSIWLTWDRAPG